MRYTKPIIEAMLRAAAHRGARDALAQDFDNAPEGALAEARRFYVDLAASAQADVDALIRQQGQRDSERTYTRQVMAEAKASKVRAKGCDMCGDGAVDEGLCPVCEEGMGE